MFLFVVRAPLWLVLSLVISSAPLTVSADPVAAPLPAAAPLKGIVVLDLTREGALGEAAKEEASFYVGEVHVGTPAQKLKIVFDTASGNVVIPHQSCEDPTCKEHRRFTPWNSTSAIDVDSQGNPYELAIRSDRDGMRDGVKLSFSQSDLGEGDIEAVLIRDHVCFGSLAVGTVDETCVDMTVLAAPKMDDKPWRAMPSDGVVGLGFGLLSVCPSCSFFNRMLEGSTGVLPQFGLALGHEKGELHLGGHDMARLADPVRWFPVDHPEMGFWQVAIQEVRVGDVVINDCKLGCHGIVDSAVSRLGVQATHIEQTRAALTSSATLDGGRCQGPDLTFDLGGMSLTLRPQDYAGQDCQPLLGALNLPEPDFVGVYAFGATVLRRYYAAFDWEQKKLGFAPLSNEEGVARAESRDLPDDLAGVLLV